MCNIKASFKRSRMCKEEAQLWAFSYLQRLMSDMQNFDSDYQILYSYPEEVVQMINDMLPHFDRKPCKEYTK